jgi:chromosome segregation ATPase
MDEEVQGLLIVQAAMGGKPMKQQDVNRLDNGCRTIEMAASRRAVMGSSVLALFGALSGSVFGRERGKSVDTAQAGNQPPKEIRERMEEVRAFSERLHNATSMEERRKIMEERRLQDRRRAIEDLREQLSVPEQEWAVVKPRLEAVYNLRHPVPQAGPGNERQRTEVQQRSAELSELLRNQEATTDRIKAGLSALRAAKERARQELAAAQQNLRQILTLRQEALLVLNGLLD